MANIERVAQDTSTETQARATAPEHNETQKEEEKPRDIDDANKSIQNQTNFIPEIVIVFVGYMPNHV